MVNIPCNATTDQYAEDRWDVQLSKRIWVFGTAVDDCHDINGVDFDDGALHPLFGVVARIRSAAGGGATGIVEIFDAVFLWPVKQEPRKRSYPLV